MSLHWWRQSIDLVNGSLTKSRLISHAARIALVYLFASIIYIYFSDRLVEVFIQDPNRLTSVQTFKGLAFVAFSSLLIYVFIVRKERENERILHDLDAKVKERTTKLEEAMFLAESTSKLKSEFLANMSHELRTPLNAIIGFSEAMLSGVYGPVNERHREYLGDILTSGEHLLGLVNDILDLSKIEAGSMDLEQRVFSLKELMGSAVGMFREKAIVHNITLECHVEDGVDEIVADQRKVKQIMVNLLSNAIKFTSAGGTVRLNVRRAADTIEVSIEDNGIGISSSDMLQLFQPFHQLESPLQKKYSGAGLGLFLTKRLIELQGGGIRVESEKGGGSIFSFSIPIKGNV
ncbi:MAG TPA: ATP-binding protein [Thermodesulfovibrionales bacterium]|nr:ATP-binding protein [Thermodesulfovibrionales bacterium]